VLVIEYYYDDQIKEGEISGENSVYGEGEKLK